MRLFYAIAGWLALAGDFTQNPIVGAKPAKTKIPAVNMLTTRQHVVHLGTLRNSFTASTSLV